MILKVPTNSPVKHENCLWFVGVTEIWLNRAIDNFSETKFFAKKEEKIIRLLLLISFCCAHTQISNVFKTFI